MPLYNLLKPTFLRIAWCTESAGIASISPLPLFPPRLHNPAPCRHSPAHPLPPSMLQNCRASHALFSLLVKFLLIYLFFAANLCFFTEPTQNSGFCENRAFTISVGP